MNNTSHTLFDIKNLRVAFASKESLVPAVSDVSLTVGLGESIGIVGESGCGKSVSWLAVLGLLKADARISGEAHLNSRQIIGADDVELSRIRGSVVSMIFQDPLSSLNPVRKIGKQIGETLALKRGLEGRTIDAEVERLMDAVGVADARQRKHCYPHEFSGGMNQRVMIAIAMAGDPQLLIADEPTTALDVTIQAQIVDLIKETQARTGMALVFISHDLNLVGEICERVCVMHDGRIVEIASPRDLFEAPKHTHTQSLLAALPGLPEAVDDQQRLPVQTTCQSNIPTVAGVQ